MTSSVKPRSYDSTGRRRLTEAKRAAVLDAALHLIGSGGYAATSIAAVAERAGVSQAFVYKQFTDKPSLARRLLDYALAGDDEPVAMSERPDIRRLVAEPDAGMELRLYAAMAAAIHLRAGALLVALAAAAPGDQLLDEVHRTSVDQRLAGAGNLVQDIAGKSGLILPIERARDVVWALISPELYALLVAERGWTSDEYRDWLATTLERSLIG